MSKETEKAMKQFIKYLEEHADEDAGIDEVNTIARQYMDSYNSPLCSNTAVEPETADDFLELAENAPTKKKRMEYVKKALALEPDNLDGGLALVTLTAKNANELLEGLSELIKKGTQQLEQDGYFKDYMGEFWGVLETRPYMRVRYEYINGLIACGMMRKAANECREMLKLCEADNLGIRYLLLHLYALLEEEEPALHLHRQFDSYEETQMLLPLAVLYYKLDQPDKSIEYLNRLVQANKDTKKFIGNMARGGLDKYEDSVNPYGYRPFSIEELIHEASEYFYLFLSVPNFFLWADKALKKK